MECIGCGKTTNGIQEIRCSTCQTIFEQLKKKGDQKYDKLCR